MQHFYAFDTQKEKAYFLTFHTNGAAHFVIFNPYSSQKQQYLSKKKKSSHDCPVITAFVFIYLISLTGFGVKLSQVLDKRVIVWL